MKRNTLTLRILALASLTLATLSSHTQGEEMLVGILYSKTSAAQAPDPSAYQQAFMAAQHQCTMAGIPFKLLEESKLSNAGNFSKFQVLILPGLSHVPADKRTKYISELGKAINEKDLNIISAGSLMAFDETNASFLDPDLANETLLGVRPEAAIGPVTATLTASDPSHPALPGYTLGETILSYQQFSGTTYSPSPLALGATHVPYCTLATPDQTFTAVGSIETTVGRRHVHFASPALMLDANLLWSAIRWSAYGSQPAVALRTGRQGSLFVARTDMEESISPDGVQNVDTPLLDIITEWKNDYNFIGNYYLNVGNDPDNGQSTDWTISAPLFQNYLALGSEIGTHSYTHPADLDSLSESELKFEFDDSRKAIKDNLDIDVLAASLPGSPAAPGTVELIAQWLPYLSGHGATTASSLGFNTAYGLPHPKSDAFYQLPNISSDTSLVQERGLTPAEAAQVWQQELTNLHRHAPLPLIHTHWHDSGPVGAAPGFNRDMYDSMISTAAALGAEFLTGTEFLERNVEFADAKLEVTLIDSDTTLAKVSGAEFGKFALQLETGTSISSVDDWYAYDNDKVLLPKNGGSFTIRTSGPPADVTRITALPPGAELVELDGDGTTIEFKLLGKGTVTVATQSGFEVDSLGADAVVPNGDQWDLTFNSDGPHQVTATRGAPLPPAPEPALTFIKTTSLSLDADLYTIHFASDPNITGWRLIASETMKDGFPDDLTHLATFNESPAGSGQYTATIDISSLGRSYFFCVGKDGLIVTP